MFYVKYFHVGFMIVWMTGLFLLPRLYAAHGRRGESADHAWFNRKAQALYFRIMTPAAILTVIAGTVLVFDGFEGAWLPVKLVFVVALVLVHTWWGYLLQHLAHGRSRHPAPLFHVMVWVPLPLVMIVVALAAAKPRTLPWF